MAPFSLSHEGGKNLPKGMEVQMLELDWINQHRTRDGQPQHVGYISGELFGAGGLTATSPSAMVLGCHLEIAVLLGEALALG